MEWGGVGLLGWARKVWAGMGIATSWDEMGWDGMEWAGWNGMG
jgi:hypothetical protein